MRISDLTNPDNCHVTRVWGFSPEDWGALGFPKDGTARRLADKADQYFVVCFVSHHRAAHIAAGDEGLVHGIYELGNSIVELENDEVIDPRHFDNENNYTQKGFRWPVGLRAVRAWRFLNPPMTKAALPDARTKSWDVSTSIVPISNFEFDLLDQYKLEQVPVYKRPFKLKRLTEPNAIPCHVYLFTCENVSILERMPRWQKGDILVKIGCASDVDGRLASFNDDPISKIFDLRLAKMTSAYVGEEEANEKERDLLAKVAELGRLATESTSEFYFISSKELSKVIIEFGGAKRVA